MILLVQVFVLWPDGKKVFCILTNLFKGHEKHAITGTYRYFNMQRSTYDEVSAAF